MALVGLHLAFEFLQLGMKSFDFRILRKLIPDHLIPLDFKSCKHEPRKIKRISLPNHNPDDRLEELTSNSSFMALLRAKPLKSLNPLSQGFRLNLTFLQL
jgi:hypothetical protein